MRFDAGDFHRLVSSTYPRRRTDNGLGDYLPPTVFQACVSAILKQGVERLDNVRQLVGEELGRLVREAPQILHQDGELKEWYLPGADVIAELLRYEQPVII